MADAVAAVRAVLVDAGVAGGRVFGGALPAGEAASMPREAVVVRAAGGGAAVQHGYMPTIDDRVDVRCYGATLAEAGALAATVGRTLHRIRDERTAHGRIVWCRASSRPTNVTEPDTGWPLALTAWQTLGDWLDD